MFRKKTAHDSVAEGSVVETGTGSSRYQSERSIKENDGSGFDFSLIQHAAVAYESAAVELEKARVHEHGPFLIERGVVVHW